MRKIVKYIRNRTLSLVITFLISIVGIIIFLVVYAPTDSLYDKIIIRVTPFIIPFITYFLTRIYNPENKYNNWINPDVDIISIPTEHDSTFAHDEKMKAIKINVFDDYQRKIINSKKVIWLTHDFTINIKQFLFNLIILGNL